MRDDLIEKSPNFVWLERALDAHPPGLVATIIEQHGITAYDRFLRTKHYLHESVPTVAALEVCAKMADHRFWADCNLDHQDYSTTQVLMDLLSNDETLPLRGAGWHADEFKKWLEQAKQVRIDAVGAEAAQREAYAASARRKGDQSKLDKTNAVLLGAMLAVLRGEVKDARAEKTVTYVSQAQIQQVLESLHDTLHPSGDPRDPYPGLSKATIERKFADAKHHFPPGKKYSVPLG